MTTAAHRAARIPWQVRLYCWTFGHQPQRIGPRAYQCTRCERVAPTPVELP